MNLMAQTLLKIWAGRNRVGTAYEFTLLLTLGCGHLSLIFTDQIHPLHSLIMILSLLSPFFSERFRRLPALFWNFLIVLVIIGSLGVALWPPRGFESYFRGISYLLIYTLIIRLLTRSAPRDDLVLFLLSMLEICAAGVMTISPLFLVTLILFAASIISSLMLFALRQELLDWQAQDYETRQKEFGTHDPRKSVSGSAALALKPVLALPLPRAFYLFSLAFCLAVFLGGFAMFFFIPRVGRSLFSWKTGIHSLVSGFSDRVELGSVGKIKLSNTLVMRVQLSGAAIPGVIYLRGNALDYFDGRRWDDTLGIRRLHYLRYEGSVSLSKVESLHDSIKQEIILEPIDSTVLFGLPQVKSVSVPFQYRAVVDYQNDYISLPLDSAIYDRLLYTVWSVASPSGKADCEEAWKGKEKSPSAEINPAYLQVPPGAGKIAELAMKVTEKETSACGRAFLLRDYLLRNYTYDLETTADQAADPISDFLFVSRKGYCEHFATAMTLLLRSAGIPARLAVGYLGGDDLNPIDNYYRIRESDAHTWVEMYLPTGEWMLLDPTPAVEPAAQAYWLAQRLKDVFDSIRYRWDRYVVDLTLRDQYRMALSMRERGLMATRSVLRLPALSALLFQSLLRNPALFLALPAGWALYFLWFRKNWRPAGPGKEKTQYLSRVIKEYARLLRAAEKRAFLRQPAETALEFANRLEKHAWPFAASFRHATDAYNQVRFGKVASDLPAIALIRSALNAVKKNSPPSN